MEKKKKKERREPGLLDVGEGRMKRGKKVIRMICGQKVIRWGR